jgi:cytoskeletal protein CcmA (bactofilin family)
MKIISAVKHSLFGTLVAIGLLSAPTAVSSEEMTVRKGNIVSDLIVSADKLLIEAEIASDLIAAGGEVEVNSNIKGDALIIGGRLDVTKTIQGGLMAMAGNLAMEANVQDAVSIFAGKATVSGDIKGDALAIGGKLIFAGDVDGDLRAAAGKLILRDRINGNVLASAGILTIEDSATITGKATLGAGTIRIEGHIIGDLRVGAGEVVISGRIDGNAKIAARSIKILPSARIAGDLIYHSPKAIQLSDQAEIGGDVTFMQSEGMMDREGGMFAMAGATHIVLVVGLIILASAFVLMIPKLFPALDRQSRGRNWSCVGLGLAVLIGGPLLISLLMVSAIGLPLGILLTAVYFLMVITGQFGSSYVLGRRMISWTKHDATRKPLYRIGATALGLSILWLLAVVPILGVIIIALATARGVGALVFELFELRTRLGQPA